MSSTVKKFVIVFTLISIFALYQGTRVTETLVVSEDGQIQGEMEKFREFIQGERFWQQQLIYVNEKLKQPEEIKKIINSLEEENKKIDAIQERLTQQYESNQIEWIQDRVKTDSYQLEKFAKKLTEIAERAKRKEDLIFLYESSLKFQTERQNIKEQILKRIESK